MVHVSRRLGVFIALLTLLFTVLNSLTAQDATVGIDDVDTSAEALLLRSPLPIQPTTADELFDAVVLMIDLARPELARVYLDKFMQLKPDEEQIFQLRQKYGTAIFLKLANIKQLQPASVTLLEAADRIAASRARNPERIAKLVADLAGTVEQQIVAMEELKRGGPIVIPSMLAMLNKSTHRKEQEVLLHALTQMGSGAAAPLIAALDAPNLDLRTMVITALGDQGTTDAMSHLWYPANSEDEPAGIRMASRQALARLLNLDPQKAGASPTARVAAELRRLAWLNYHHQHNWRVDENGMVEFWSWNDEAETVVQQMLEPRAASNILGSKFARQALALAPDDQETQVLFLSMALAADTYQAGWDEPLPTGPGTAHDLALAAGEKVVTEVLREAMESGQIPNATAALKVLGKIGTRGLIQSQTTARSPLLAALNHPDHRVQFMAADTIMQLDPQTKFRGTDRVVAIFARALSAQGRPTALVVDPNARRGSRLGGMLGELGYTPEVVTTGRQGFKVAANQANVELVLLHPNTIRWGLSQTIANLRADSRTAAIPIILHGPSEFAGRMRRHVDDNPLVAYFQSSATSQAFVSQLSPFLKKLPAPPMNEAQRTKHAERAAYWLARIADGERTKIYNISPAASALFDAVHDPNLTGNCLIAIGAIPTAESQQQLADMVIREGVETRVRMHAAMQLVSHIHRHGLLLTTSQLNAIHEIWRNPDDPDLHTAVSSVIGSLKPNSQLVGERLGKFKGTPAP